MLMAPDGRSLAAIVAAAMDHAGLRVVVAGPGHVLPDRPHVGDLIPDAGPLAAIAAGLGLPGVSAIVAIPSDMPWLDGATIRRLLDCDPPTAAEGATSAAAIAAFVDPAEPTRTLPLPARFSAALAPTARALLSEGRRAVHALHDAAAVHRVELAADEAFRLEDVDTPAAWTEFVRTWNRADAPRRGCRDAAIRPSARPQAG